MALTITIFSHLMECASIQYDFMSLCLLCKCVCVSEPVLIVADHSNLISSPMVIGWNHLLLLADHAALGVSPIDDLWVNQLN